MPTTDAVRTRLSVCARKVRHASAAAALAVATAAALPLRAYRCDRCGWFHLTSRTKGKRVARDASEIAPATVGEFLG